MLTKKSFTDLFIRSISFLFTFLYLNTAFLQAQCLKGDCLNGSGTYIYPDNTLYIGNFKNGSAEGHGICYYTNGNRYIGNWKEHTFHGEGTLFYKNGEYYKGTWENGQLTKPESTTTMGFAAESKMPRIWALVIGISQYTDIASLKFADDDAFRVYSFLKSAEGGAVNEAQIQLLVDEKATRAGILNALQQLEKGMTSDDVLFVYFSGHGLRDCLITYDYDGLKGKIFHHEINQFLEKNVAKHKICLIDACHSGSIENMVSLRGASDYGNSIYDVFSSVKGGTALFLSSKAEESSVENEGLRQGVFSYFVIKGLKGAANADENRIITVQELFKYVYDNVTTYTQGHQTPVLHGNYDPKMPMSVMKQ